MDGYTNFSYLTHMFNFLLKNFIFKLYSNKYILQIIKILKKLITYFIKKYFFLLLLLLLLLYVKKENKN